MKIFWEVVVAVTYRRDGERVESQHRIVFEAKSEPVAALGGFLLGDRVIRNLFGKPEDETFKKARPFIGCVKAGAWSPGSTDGKTFDNEHRGFLGGYEWKYDTGLPENVEREELKTRK